MQAGLSQGGARELLFYCAGALVVTPVTPAPQGVGRQPAPTTATVAMAAELARRRHGGDGGGADPPTFRTSGDI
jgi:hypothetical protein